MPCAPTPQQQLVLDNMAFIHWRVRRWLGPTRRGELYEDLVHEGVLGALRAAQTWREGAGSTFISWARMDVDNRITTALRRLPYTVMPPHIAPGTNAYRDGKRGHAPPLWRSGDDTALESCAAETEDGDEALDAAALAGRARAELLRRSGGTASAARRVDVFLRWLGGERQVDLARAVGVSREGVRRMLLAVRPHFEAWAADVRREGR